MIKEYRWPIAVVGILLVTICVNIAFAWVAIEDKSGGFRLADDYSEDASYRLKMPLEKKD